MIPEAILRYSRKFADFFAIMSAITECLDRLVFLAAVLLDLNGGRMNI